MKPPLVVVEFLAFVVPYCFVPVMSVIGLMWTIANKSQWDRLPWQIGYLVATILGLIALIRVFNRRHKGDKHVGGFETLLLVIGLVSCFWPLADLFLRVIPNSRYPVENDKYLAGLLFLWPVPVYLHWLLDRKPRAPAAD